MALLTTMSVGPAQAEPETDLDLELLPELLVVGVTPVIGADLERDRVPQTTWVIGRDDVDRTGVPSLTDAILERIPSVTINDTEGNKFQPDLLFRGFTVSPVAGTPEGLAIYLNGARFNDAFGDTVNWDLIPPVAIDTVNIEASNPLFGLNALGGSLNVKLKTGFSDAGDSATLYAGSYGREAAILELSGQSGPFGVYVAGDATHDAGFRLTSTSDLYRLFMDFGWREAGSELHFAVLGAHDTLGNPGATPEQALNAGIGNIFTAPNVVDNTYLAFNLHGTHELAEHASLQGLAYFQTLNQVIPNGTTVDVQPCDNGTGLLCNDDGRVVTGLGGVLVPDFL
ncbi:MAG TPA: TonB-dependent receptor, partial [Steroidobacteraceae bacterium]|nr:TonB-dependent receptor [Steroidobacteraceae bacterium]